MKKIAIIILLAITSFSYAQEQEYDTIIYFPQTIFECPMLWDPVYGGAVAYNNLAEYNAWIAAGGNEGSGWFQPDYTTFYRLRRLCYASDSAISSIDQDYLSTFSLAQIVGFETMPGIRSFAQPYYLLDLDTAARVIGVAAKIKGHRPPMAQVPYFFLYDNNGVMIDASPVLHFDGYGQYDQTPTTFDYHYFANQHQIQAFSLAFDKNHTHYEHEIADNEPYLFDHTITFKGGDPKLEWYQDCRYEDLGCYEYLPPLYLMYDSTNWVSFDQDQYYQFYYKKQIGFFPIIIVPKTENSLSAEELSEHCNILPNPATTYAKVLSRYKIERLEVFDIQGKKIEEINVNDYEYYIGVQNYNKGTYLVNIVTQKGTTTKKMIVQ